MTKKNIKFLFSLEVEDGRWFLWFYANVFKTKSINFECKERLVIIVINNKTIDRQPNQTKKGSKQCRKVDP